LYFQEPDASKVRTWTDRSKSFSVDAQFLGLKDGKINLHKMNGVKIAVPVAKMSLSDLEYVERMTGISLDEDKPLSDLKKRSAADSSRSGKSSTRVGASIEQPKKSDYDWFQFFLNCEVNVGLCERYAQAFGRESMDESVLPDVDASVLRNLGIREGDIIKVMRFLDNKYARNKKGSGGEDGEAAGGLFSGPGGALRNNTRKGRPAPPVETTNVVDVNAFSQQKDSGASEAKAQSPTTAGPAPTASSSSSKPSGGFDDDAWDVKPSKSKPAEPAAPPASRAPEPAPAPVAAPAPAPANPLTGSMQELSLLTQPLQPEKVQPTPAPPVLSLAPAVTPAALPAQAQIPQPTGATPGFFTGIQPPAPAGQQFTQSQAARQRPVAPQYTQNQGSLMAPPPPSRPLSAPQSVQPSAFTPPPLQPQMTGYQTQVAPPGQSLNDIAQARLQQQYMQMQQQQQQQQQQMHQQQMQQQPMMPMMTGIPVQQTGFAPQQNQFLPPQQTGMMNPQQQQQFGQPGPIPMQPTGYVNNFLPQPLEPQRTAMPMQPMQPMQTGFGQPQQGFGMGGGGGLAAPMQPLLPQMTGPPPPVRFGVDSTKKLAPQPTGRRANLSAASELPC